ncbi:Alpha-acetolactate decarboxylase [Virgibacillus dokdonensis]|uniref:Alpha-acetolactate decarboxylase n=1 Tax=Virgibacillus dokdonensis TaxID=302167 RepID=A0A2K9IUS4_9BACI|nr:Alpha-acetolactate decarboxylase [Virgibacillus dokdonensis]
MKSTRVFVLGGTTIGISSLHVMDSLLYSTWVVDTLNLKFVDTVISRLPKNTSFWTPHYVNGVAVSGFHLHFIDEHRRSGGHVFNYEIEKSTVQISQKSSMHLRLPNTKDFFKANLDKHDFVTGIEATEGDPE